MTYQNVEKRVIEFNSGFQSFKNLIHARKAASLIIAEPVTDIIESTDSGIFHALSDKIESIMENTATIRKDSFLDIFQDPDSFSESALKPLDKLFKPAPTAFEITTVEAPIPVGNKQVFAETFSMDIVLNEKQLAGKEMAYAGKSFCFIGPAGSGKTTGQRSIAESLILDSRLSVSRFKSYDANGKRIYISAPSIAFIACTRRAAGNLAKAILKSPVLKDKLQHNIMTLHSLLEYEPETYFDAEEQKDKFRFSPVRTASNPLDITHLVIEEASMLGVTDLWPKLYDALPCGVQIIFVGDINQLPPVFGPSILNYALTQLPIIELTETYRNQGIVLDNAHNILQGRDIVETDKYKIVRGTKPVQEGQIVMSEKLGTLFKIMYNKYDADGNREYDPEDCIILSPFNVKPLGTTNMNKWVAQFLGAERKAVVHEIIAGFAKHYLAVGDKIMYNKMDATIIDIVHNPEYMGKRPQEAGINLTRFGHRIIAAETYHDDFADIDYADFSLEALAEEKVERKQQASHIIKIEYDDGRVESISSSGDLGDASFTLGYCLSVHKAQGSEWRKVFIIMHKDHSVMLFRELFYTAATRARTEVVIIAKDITVKKTIARQRIKGTSLKDKIEYFNSGQLKYSDVVCVK